MVNTKKVLLIIFLVLIPTAAVISSIHLYTESQKEVLGVEVRKEECSFYVSNLIPRVAYVGKEYYYIPRIVGCEEENFQVEVEGIGWLSVTGGYILAGVPTQSDVGTYKVIITVKSSSAEYIMEDYIIVKEYEE